MKSTRKYFIISFFIVLIAILAAYLNTTVHELEEGVGDYTPLRDDDAARRFAPALSSNDDFGFPVKCYYRAARDRDGNLHLAYHPVWTHERNNSGGFMPFLSRILYTGGLSIQRFMFGRGDVEVLSMTINPAGKIIGIEYERPKNYNPATFTVAHETVRLRKEFIHPPVFAVVSWNHLFEIDRENTASQNSEKKLWRCNPEYFTDELWNEYTMVRLKETRLRKSRAHLPWERVSAK